VARISFFLVLPRSNLHKHDYERILALSPPVHSYLTNSRQTFDLLPLPPRDSLACATSTRVKVLPSCHFLPMFISSKSASASQGKDFTELIRNSFMNIYLKQATIVNQKTHQPLNGRSRL